MDAVIPLLLMFGVVYFLIIRPQQQEKATHDELISSLTKGNQVVLASGIHGRVVSVDDETMKLEVSDKTRITVEKAAVARRVE